MQENAALRETHDEVYLKICKLCLTLTQVEKRMATIEEVLGGLHIPLPEEDGRVTPPPVPDALRYIYKEYDLLEGFALSLKKDVKVYGDWLQDRGYFGDDMFPQSP